MSISIIYENTLFREALLSFFRERGFEISGTYDSYSDLKRVSFGEIFIIQSTQAGESLPEKIQSLKRLNPDVRTVVLTSDDVSKSLKKRLMGIATAVIPETKSAETLICALKLVHEGFHVTPGSAVRPSSSEPMSVPAHGPDKTIRQPEENTKVSTLSKREVGVLAHICSGETNKTIAKALGISDATVKAHLRSSFRKIGVQNRTQAAIWAAQNF